jgi:2,4-diaminopentanoate dehydrogenase
MRKWKVVSVGLGSIGISIAKLALSRPQIEIVGAVDSDPRLVGRDICDVLGMNKSTGIVIAKEGQALYKKADVVIQATTSFLSSAEPQLLEFCKNGVDVVSTCEELAYPWFSHAGIANELDAAAKKNKVTLLGTGVNPGFVMDLIPGTLSGVCQRVSEIKATRILDATKRRLPFQMKVGIGLSVDKFEENVRTGKFGHIGLPESIALSCASLGIAIDKIDQKITPKIATSPVKTEHFGTVGKGKVIGLVQDGEGFAKGIRVASYHIEMYAGASDPRDEIELVGVPNISIRIPGGTPGDVATAAIIVNSIPRVIDSRPGLLTVKDLRPASSVFGWSR